MQERVGSKKRAYAFYHKQMLEHLNPLMRDFIGRQEMFFIGTADAGGESDCSFRAGAPGFVSVVDAHTLIYPEIRGNGVMASLGNITENPHVGMLFIDFFESTVGLHVNGRAERLELADVAARADLSEAAHGVSQHEGYGFQPECWVLVSVEEAYIQCAKHIPLLAKLDKARAWGTDDEVKKGGDYFKAKASVRPWGVR